MGFVNESKLHVDGDVEARTALLRQWVDAGATLGNPTYSHADFNTVTVEQFQDEIRRGEVVTRRLMADREPYQLYFRHPQTHTGDTPEKKAAIEAFLSRWRPRRSRKALRRRFLVATSPPTRFRGDPEVPAWVMELYRRARR